MSSTADKAQGLWHEILTRLGVDGSLLDGKHHPSPISGGVDGFRFIDKQGDGYYVNNNEFGDGFGFLYLLNGWDFKEAAKQIDDVMGWSDGNYKPPTKQEKAEITARHEKLTAEREAALKEQHTIAAKASLALWEGASMADDSHPYPKAKGVHAYGIRQHNGSLVFPIRVNGEITSLQFIDKDGGKMFTASGNVSGGYFPITGDNRASVELVVICEGYATGASIREATGQHVIVAFNAGNLHKVAQAIRNKHPDTKIIIAADNDQKNKVNAGLEAAYKAAELVVGVIALPVGKEGFNVDWNDIHAAQGLKVVSAGIANAVTPNELRSILGEVVSTTPEKKDASISSEQVEKPKSLENNNDLIIERLAALSLIEYDQVRTSEAEALDIRTSTLDSLVKTARKEANRENDIFPEIEPWGDVVDGEALLEEMAGVFKRYAILPDHAPEVAALWILNTYVHDAGYNSPMIMITSPEKRCGKTTTLNLFQALVRKPLSAGNISSAAIYRSIEKWQPTLLIDEADTFMKNNDEVAGVINSGHTKPTAFVVRCDGDDSEPKQFSTWCPKVIAGIGSQRDTLEDRSIIFPLRRKLPHERVKRLRLDRGGFDDVVRKCVRWGADNFTKCLSSDPEPIAGLEDRANDNWSPLLAIAELCGWGEKARISAVLIRGGIEESESIDTVLLKDIQTIYKEQRAERLSSQRICTLLAAIDDRPWSEWSKGRAITTNKLAGRVKAFNIHSKSMRLPNGDRLKGYDLDEFPDAFGRYCILDR
ncbi:MAG: DUF3631 domain-containing protein, partial [Ghiorsea sp.]